MITRQFKLSSLSLSFKTLSTICLVVLSIITTNNVSAQQTRARRANMGMDGELTSDMMRSKSTAMGKDTGSNDWFKRKVSTATGEGVFDGRGDTADLWFHTVATKNNWSFFVNGQYEAYHKNKGITWIKAAYLRDNVGNDSTYFAGSNKNAQDPTTQWAGGVVNNATGKDDIIDGGLFIVRDTLGTYKGSNHKDSLWFMGFFVTESQSGSRLADYELFRRQANYSKITGKFTNTGNPGQGGHSAWEFNKSTGLITYFGDIIVATEAGSSGVQLIDLRIWMRKAQYDSMLANQAATPAGFKFNVATGGGLVPFQAGLNGYGYASVDFAAASVPFFIGEVSDTLTFRPTPPWGSYDASGTRILPGGQYNQGQFIEFGLNLTALNMDPVGYKFLDPTKDWCETPFTSIMIKTRTSGSASATLKDFIGPTNFKLDPLSLTSSNTGKNCITDTASLLVTNNTGANANAYYEWVNTSSPGTVLSTSPTYKTTTAGTYKVYVSRGPGCLRVDSNTRVVKLDTLTPFATAVPKYTVTPDAVTMTWIGGDSAQSVINTSRDPSFGNSQGITWKWQGPIPTATVVATTKNYTQTFGANLSVKYLLTVTEKRNGCADTEYVFLTTLDLHMKDFHCSSLGNAVQLNWETLYEKDMRSFQVYRNKGATYEQIAEIPAYGYSNTLRSYTYTDNTPNENGSTYKLVGINKFGQTEFVDYCSRGGSRPITLNNNISMSPNPVNNVLNVRANLTEAKTLHCRLVDVNGRVISAFSFNGTDGVNNYSLKTEYLTPGVYVISVQGEGINFNKQFIKN
jgi:hypothetical protein